ncbi:MAG TPA: hypothetical protein DCL21_00440 [Alphaproteobacteria bacterium]|nr:hypothetical protein [Alphaproteobacteria bacterium]
MKLNTMMFVKRAGIAALVAVVVTLFGSYAIEERNAAETTAAANATNKAASLIKAFEVNLDASHLALLKVNDNFIQRQTLQVGARQVNEPLNKVQYRFKAMRQSLYGSEKHGFKPLEATIYPDGVEEFVLTHLNKDSYQGNWGELTGKSYEPSVFGLLDLKADLAKYHDGLAQSLKIFYAVSARKVSASSIKEALPQMGLNYAGDVNFLEGVDFSTVNAAIPTAKQIDLMIDELRLVKTKDYTATYFFVGLGIFVLLVVICWFILNRVRVNSIAAKKAEIKEKRKDLQRSYSQDMQSHNLIKKVKDDFFFETTGNAPLDLFGEHVAEIKKNEDTINKQMQHINAAPRYRKLMKPLIKAVRKELKLSHEQDAAYALTYEYRDTKWRIANLKSDISNLETLVEKRRKAYEHESFLCKTKNANKSALVIAREEHSSAKKELEVKQERLAQLQKAIADKYSETEIIELDSFIAQYQEDFTQRSKKLALEVARMRAVLYSREKQFANAESVIVKCEEEIETISIKIEKLEIYSVDYFNMLENMYEESRNEIESVEQVRKDIVAKEIEIKKEIEEKEALETSTLNHVVFEFMGKQKALECKAL